MPLPFFTSLIYSYSTYKTFPKFEDFLSPSDRGSHLPLHTPFFSLSCMDHRDRCLVKWLSPHLTAGNPILPCFNCQHGSQPRRALHQCFLHRGEEDLQKQEGRLAESSSIFMFPATCMGARARAHAHTHTHTHTHTQSNRWGVMWLKPSGSGVQRARKAASSFGQRPADVKTLRHNE